MTAKLVSFEKLPKTFKLIDFVSDDPIKTDYFLKNCAEFQVRNLIHKTKCYISPGDELIGFFSLSMSRFVMRIKKEKTFIPFLWVTNFGISLNYRNNSKSEIEDFFIANIYKTGKLLSTIVGCRFILFEISKDLNKNVIDKELYQKLINYGFNHFPEDCIYKKKDEPYSQIERTYNDKLVLEKVFYDLREDDSQDKWS